MIFLEGYLIGLAMIVFIGPVFFTLLQSSLQFGKFSGIMVALGIIVSDIICVLIYYFGLNNIDLPESSKFILALLGALILTVLGLKNIILKPSQTEVEFSSKLNLISSFVKGFLVNFVNPFVFIVWAGLFVYAKESTSNDSETLFHLTAVLAGILSTDLLKVVLAKKIKPFLKPKILEKATKIFGIIMIGFAIRLILYLYTL